MLPKRAETLSVVLLSVIVRHWLSSLRNHGLSARRSSGNVRPRPPQSSIFLWADLWAVARNHSVYLAFRHERASRYMDHLKLSLRSKFVERRLAHTKGQTGVLDAACFGLDHLGGSSGEARSIPIQTDFAARSDRPGMTAAYISGVTVSSVRMTSARTARMPDER